MHAVFPLIIKVGIDVAIIGRHHTIAASDGCRHLPFASVLAARNFFRTCRLRKFTHFHPRLRGPNLQIILHRVIAQEIQPENHRRFFHPDRCVD